MAHLYNLRQQPRYRERRLYYTKTRPTAVTIGERRRPDPQGRPGYLRVDTVHQGDRPQAKGVYHINAVDQVTQWQIVSATPRICEAWLEPVLAAMLRQFPFRILGFHSDNGSEFINRTVARLLNKLLIEQTRKPPPAQQRQRTGRNQEWRGDPQTHGLRLHRRRPRRSHPAVLQPRISIPISTTIVPAPKPISKSTRKAVNAATTRRYQTPLETLLALSQPTLPAPGLTLAVLQRIAAARSDTEAAQRMQQAKRKLFEPLRRPAGLGEGGNSRPTGRRKKGGGNDAGAKPSGFAGPASKSLRDSHIPHPPRRLLDSSNTNQGAFLRHPLRLPSGSSLD